MTSSLGQSVWQLSFGARPVDGGILFRAWAPLATDLAVRIIAPRQATFAMERDEDDVFSVLVPDLAPGAEYFYVIDGARERPDPVSRSQPRGVHGPSRVVDPDAYSWTENAWEGLKLEDYLIYELHTGTFSGEGTFAGIAAKLPYLRELGITAVELMPVAEFPGTRNWGYDGACLYAPHTAYGGVDGLKALVDACHRQGLAVIVDVVYNHLGPEGSYLGDYAPCFTSRYRTPWGDAINFDGPLSDGVRRFFVENALYWLTEYQVDALRLDAVHGIYDFGARHLLRELSDAFHRQARGLGRRAWLIAESDLNDVRVINPAGRGGHELDAQWNDDFHHALHTLLTGDRQGYFADFGRLDDLRKAIAEGFVYDGRRSIYRRRRHGNSSAANAGRQFVAFAQNHDQIGNASTGLRMASRISLAGQKLAALILLCTPNLPLLFMGQEYGATTPFLFFTSFPDSTLGHAVSEGRRAEYAKFYEDQPFPDPQAPETFDDSCLDWTEPAGPPHRELLDFYRTLIALRKATPALANCRKDLTRVRSDESGRWIVIHRRDPAASPALIAANLGSSPVDVPIPRGPRKRLALWTGTRPDTGDAEGEPPPATVAAGTRKIILAPLSGALYLADDREPAAD